MINAELSKSKAIPVTGRGGQYGWKTSRFQHYLDIDDGLMCPVPGGVTGPACSWGVYIKTGTWPSRFGESLMKE
jgi:hypothetical protein